MKQKFFARIGMWITPPCIRKSLTSLKALLLLLVMGLSVNVWGADVTAYKTLTFPDDNSASNKKSDYTSTWTAKKGTDEWSISNFNNNSWNSWTYIRCGRKNYASVAAIISPQMSVKIEAVTIDIGAITVSKVNSIKLYTSTNKSSWTAVGEYTQATGAQKVDIASANQATDLYYKVEFDCASGSSNGLVQINKVEYFEAQETPIGIVAAPTFTPETGAEFYPSLNVTLAQKDSKTIYYTKNTEYTSNEDVFAEGTEYTSAINLDATTTIQAVAIDGDNISEIANATYTKATPLSTMDEIFTASATKGDYYITFNNWVISGVKNSNAYLTDNNGKGLIIYKSGHGFVAGDVLSGTVQCALTKYSGSAEITDLTSSSTGLTVTKGGSVTAVEKSISDLSGVNTGALINLGDLTYNGSKIFSDGTNTITAYNGIMSSLPTWNSGLVHTVKGIYIQFNDTKEIAPRDANDIVEKQADKFAITIADGIQNGSVSVQGSKTQAAEDESVTLLIAPNTGYKLGTLTVDGSDVTAFVSDNKYTFSMPGHAVNVSATFAAKDVYTITWKVKGVTPDATTQVTEGETLSLPTDPEYSGYQFVGWTANAIEGKQSTPPTLLANNTIPTESKTYYAVFAVVVGTEPLEGSYTLDYAAEGLADKSGWGAYGTVLEYTALDGSKWAVNAFKSSGMQINKGKTGICHIKVPSCPGYITAINITANASAKSATKFSATLDESATALATATEGTSQTLDLTGKNVTDGYILATGNVQITKVVVNYSGSQDVFDNYTTNPTTQVKIHFELGDGTGTFNDVSIDEGSDYTVTTDKPTPATGYEFVDWTNGDNHYVGGNTIENVTSDITLTAQYKKAWYTVSDASTTTEGSVQISSLTEGKAEFDATVTLTPAPEIGFAFESIEAYKAGEEATKVDLTPAGDNYTFTMPAYAVEVRATFLAAASSCDINFYAAGNTTPMTTISKKRGEAYEIEEVGTAVEGFTFVGWTTAPQAEEVASIQMVETVTPPMDSEDPINLYAVYKRTAVEPAYEKVTAEPSSWEGQYLIVYEDGSVAMDGSLTADVTNNSIDVTITDNKIKSNATTDAANFTVALKEGSIYSMKSASNKYITGTITTTKASNGVKYYGTSDNIEITFDNDLYVESKSSDMQMIMRYNKADDQKRFRFYKATTTNMENVALYKLGEASYVYTTSPIVKYTISYDLAEGTAGEGNFDAQEVVKGETATLTTSIPVAPTGYEFDGWYNGDVKVGATIENVQNDIELVAHYNILSYEVTTPIVDNGTIEVATLTAGKAEYNAELTITLTPATDFEVVPNSLKVYETDNESNVVTVSDNKFNMPAFPVTVAAAFQAVTPSYDITIVAGDNGSAKFDGEEDATLSLKEADEKTIIATADEGYVFAGWEVTSGIINIADKTLETTTITVGTSDATITANFEAIPSVTYTKITTIDDLAYNDKVIIVAATADKAMSATQNTNNRSEVAITRGDEGATVTLATDAVAVLDVLSGNAAQTFAFHDANGYLYAASSSSNHMKSKNELDANGNGNWNVTISEGSATIKAKGTNTRNLMQYNPNNGNGLFTCYASHNDNYQYVSLYRIASEDQVLVTLMNGEDVFARYRADKNSSITLNGFAPDIEGKTVIGWTDGETVYELNDEVAVAETDITLDIAFAPELVRSDLSNGQLITVCWDKNITSVEGGKFYEIDHGTTSEVTFVEITEFPIAKATPLLFESDGTEMKMYCGNDKIEEGDENNIVEHRAMKGLVQTASARPLIAEGNILISGGRLRLVGANCYLTAGHAYISEEELATLEPLQQQSGVARRRLVLTNTEAQVVTGLNAVMMQTGTHKFIKNHRMIIVRDGKMYNAQGQFMK